MAKLTNGEREKLPANDFALPGHRYPIEDEAHARNAKARAAQQAKAGKLSKADLAKVDRKADAVLKKVTPVSGVIEVLDAFADAFNRDDVAAISLNDAGGRRFEASAGPEVQGAVRRGGNEIGRAFVRSSTNFPDGREDDPRTSLPEFEQ